MPRIQVTLCMLSVCLSAFLAGSRLTSAAVIVFTNETLFQTTTGAPIVATFETKAFGPTAAFSEGGVAFAAHPPLNNLYIINSSVTNTHPTPTSKGLTGSGEDDIDMTLPSGTLAVGFNDITNRYAPAVVTLTQADGSVLATYTMTQGTNTYGFVGFTSDIAIAKVRWDATGGGIENTMIDNVRVGPVASPAFTATWGRIKGLYR